MKTDKETFLAEVHFAIALQKTNNPVEIDKIPELLKSDFNRFIMGETLQAMNGKVVIGPKRYREWINKIMTKGLDYEIQLENS